MVRPRDDRQGRPQCPQGQPPHPPPPTPPENPNPFFLIGADPLPKLSLHSQEFANRIRRQAPRYGDKWHLDEVVRGGGAVLSIVLAGHPKLCNALGPNREEIGSRFAVFPFEAWSVSRVGGLSKGHSVGSGDGGAHRRTRATAR